MERIIFNDTYDIASKMMEKLRNGADSVSAICFYELATSITEDLIRDGCKLDFADISDYSYNHYDHEYSVTISVDHEGDRKGFVSILPIYEKSNEKEGYLIYYSDVIYVHQDCNSKLLKYMDAEEMYEFAIDGLDEDDTAEDSDLHTQLSEYTNVSKKADGTPTGFSKSWHSVDKNGSTTYTSYSFMSDNRKMLKTMMDVFGLKV